MKKMTQKEELLYKYYQVLNETNEITGNEYRWDVDDMLETGYLARLGRKDVVAVLQHRLDTAIKSLDLTKNELRKKEYLKTEEGQAALASVKSRQDELSSKYLALKSNTMIELTELLSGTGFSIRHFGDRSAELTTGTHQFNSIDVYYDNYSFGNEGPRFEVNVGSTGSFEIDSDRASFYVALGKFLASPKLESIKSLLIGFNEKVEEIDKESYKLREEEDNLGSSIR